MIWAILAVVWTGILSVVSIAFYAVDKRRAVRNRDGARKRRVPERTLHLIDLAGGWPGGLLARRLFSHKTNSQTKARFVWTTRAIIVIHLLAWAAIGYFVFIR
jgi:uncharacterized membrane protein YsdA (DUF1294 family)